MITHYDIIDHSGTVSNQLVYLAHDTWFDRYAVETRTAEDTQRLIQRYKEFGWHVVAIEKEPLQAPEVQSIIPIGCTEIECVFNFGDRKYLSFSFTYSGQGDVWYHGNAGIMSYKVIAPQSKVEEIISQRRRVKEEIRFYNREGVRI